MSAIDEDYLRLRRSVEAKLEAQSAQAPQALSREYQSFKKQYLPRHLTLYERACKFAESLGIKPPPEQETLYLRAIETCHLGVTPKGAYGLALLVTLTLLVIGVLVSLVIPKLLSGHMSVYFFLVFTVLALGLYVPVQRLPFTFAEQWRQRASNQMVLCLFYVVTYMRHTSTGDVRN